MGNLLLQCVAVCCRKTERDRQRGRETGRKEGMLLQCVAVCCSVLQCVAEERARGVEQQTATKRKERKNETERGGRKKYAENQRESDRQPE